MGTSIEVFKRYNSNKIFVETGSYMGDGINKAFLAGYSKVYSIELSNSWVNYCRNRFGNRSDLVLVQGDSAEVLESIISAIEEPITFWLDGHWSCGDTALGKYGPSPLLLELDIIKNHKIKNHTIIIDDMKSWTPNYVYPPNTNIRVNFEKKDIIEKLLVINEAYRFEYIDYTYGVATDITGKIQEAMCPVDINQLANTEMDILIATT